MKRTIFRLGVGGALAVLSINSLLAEVQTGVLKSEMFPGATRQQVESGAVTAPSSIEYINVLSFQDTADNYTRRVTGFFIPPTTGNYVFFITSDDDSDLFLSTDATPANKRLIAQETTWSAVLQWTESSGGSNVDQKRSDRFRPDGATNAPFAQGIPLTANQRYYLEVVHHEGASGDNLAVTYKLVADPDPEVGIDSALSGAVIAADVPTSAVFVSQPFSRRLAPGQSATLSVTVDPPDAALQWYRNNTAIDGAINPTLDIGPVTEADNGAVYQVRATLGTATTTSSNAVITVGQLVALTGHARRELWNDDALILTDVEDPSFAIPPDEITAEPAFESPSDVSDNYVQRMSGLFVAPTTGNYIFFVAADDQANLFLSTDATPANKRLIAQETGWSAVRNWTGANGAGAGLSTEQSVAQKRSDRFIPDPVNDPGATPPFASGIALTAGQSYYIEAVHEEGGGGDNLAVTYKLVGEPDPAAGEATRIRGPLLGPWAEALDGAQIQVVSGPTSTNGLQSRTVTLSVNATSSYIGDTSPARPGLNYQWQTAPAGSTTFTNIPGAVTATYTTPLLRLDDTGRQFRVVISAADATTNSPVAVVNVTPDTVPPRPVTVTSVNAGRNIVTLNFNELLDVDSAQTASNYVFSAGGVNTTATSAALTNGTNVTITTSAPLTPNVEITLAITGVADLAGTPVAPNTTIKFTFNPVTYAANILFDEPIAYYRFEETSGTVATNSGSMGGHGVYAEGDEPTPMEGGFPREANNTEGPRAPEFAGFDASNLAANFDGFDDWVDTRNQFLQARSAFTLEYWVKPNRTNEFEEPWPNRVAIVGQNDAIEYGFINPGTIQIWTAGGGSLDTAYTFPDDTWHHVATVADGTSIRTYYDGVLAGTGGTATANYGSAGFNVHIGGGGGFDATGNWFTGQIDEVAIFDKAIPAARVAAHYQAGKEGGVITISGAVTPEDPGGGEGTRVEIARGTGNTLTISWDGGGTLETTAALGANATWTEAGTTSPATIQATDSARFYRVRR